MSRNRGADRRVQRTHRLLHGALASLIGEKDYDAIAVRDILDRADVGRSTFYTHFGDKDELLTSSIFELLRSSEANGRFGSPVDRLIRFSRPIFEHHEQHRPSGPPSDIKGRRAVHERLRQVLVRQITDELEHGKEWSDRSPRIPAELLAQHVGSAFILVLNWWLESGSRLSPSDVNEIFRSLVLPALARR